MSDVTRILSQIDSGDPSAAEQLLPLVYDELRKLAAAKLAHEKPGQTLQATALVHEAYLRLVGPANRDGFEGRGHFFAAASQAMRRILVENARRKSQPKHGGGWNRIELDRVEAAANVTDEQLLAIDEALSQLEALDAEAARLFALRYFCDQSVEQAAEALGVSRATAYRQWNFARAWLLSRLQSGDQT
jgi:RNA polymerase sigma factor (TIGR02999 family)